MRKITITMNRRTGETKVTTEGFKGEACLTATAALEAAIGEVKATQPTPEMYDTDVESIEIKS